MIVILGGSGYLGSELSKNKDTISLDSKLDIYDFQNLKIFLDEINPKIIINCVAIKSEKVDLDPIKSINVNIIGSANISKYCIEKKN